MKSEKFKSKFNLAKKMLARLKASAEKEEHEEKFTSVLDELLKKGPKKGSSSKDEDEDEDDIFSTSSGPGK